jgi:hypothetical protein
MGVAGRDGDHHGLADPARDLALSGAVGAKFSFVTYA